MNKWFKAIIKSLAAIFGFFPFAENVAGATCDLCIGAENEKKLLQATNNLHMRCPACGRLIRPHS